MIKIIYNKGKGKTEITGNIMDNTMALGRIVHEISKENKILRDVFIFGAVSQMSKEEALDVIERIFKSKDKADKELDEAEKDPIKMANLKAEMAEFTKNISRKK